MAPGAVHGSTLGRDTAGPRGQRSGVAPQLLPPDLTTDVVRCHDAGSERLVTGRMT